ncbi:MAG: hypothetical protein JSR93_09075 [Verrucomicrobia bacterium]|nr:hypothetical protein [Verrucomicrobiota bacterium]
MSSLTIKGDQTPLITQTLGEQSPSKKGEIRQYRFLGTHHEILAERVEAPDEVYLLALSSKVKPLLQAIARVESRLTNFEDQVSVSSLKNPETPVTTIRLRLFEYLLDDATRFDKKVQKLIGAYPKAEALFCGQDMRLKEIIQQMSHPSSSPSSSSAISLIELHSDPVALLTPITIQFPARLGEHLYIRGEGSGLTWEQRVPLINIDANTWQLRQPMQGEFKFKILLNNEEWETGNDHLAKGGDEISVSPVFASQAEKRAEAATPTRISFFYQPSDGETLEVRDSMHDWHVGIELKSMGNGMWVWETDKAASEFDFKLVRRQSSGEVIWEGGDNRKMQPAQVIFIEPRF